MMDPLKPTPGEDLVTESSLKAAAQRTEESHAPRRRAAVNAVKATVASLL